MDYFTEQLEVEFNKLSWDEVYRSIEFVLSSQNKYHANDLESRLNNVFYEEGSPYKIVNGHVNCLMNKTEAHEILEVQNLENSAAVHINKALKLFNTRPVPDYSNSIKESISAIEAASREITGKESATLYDAVKRMDLHPALKEAVSKLYAWTGDEGGIRHALKNSNQADSKEIEARFILVFSSALVNFLMEKNKK